MKCSLNVKNSRRIVLLLQLSLIKMAQTTLEKRGTTQTIRNDKVLNLEIIIKATRIIMDTCSLTKGIYFLVHKGVLHSIPLKTVLFVNYVTKLDILLGSVGLAHPSISHHKKISWLENHKFIMPIG